MGDRPGLDMARRQAGRTLPYTLFFRAYQPKSPRFLRFGDTKSTKLEFPENFPWFRAPGRSDNKPAAFSSSSSRADCAMSTPQGSGNGACSTRSVHGKKPDSWSLE